MQLPPALLSLLILLLPTPSTSAPLSLQPQTSLSHPFRIPTRLESTTLARRLLSLSTTGVLSTTFPVNLTNTRLPSDLATLPIALPDYIATCEEFTHPGDPTLLALSVSTSTRNALAGSNVSLSVDWWDGYSRVAHKRPWSMANLPRMSLIGYLEEIGWEDVQGQGVVECYTKVHGDSRLWLPGDTGAAHEGRWMRLVVKDVYWIGGFGDRAYIGWFEGEEWKGVRREEYEGVRLPGECE